MGLALDTSAVVDAERAGDDVWNLLPEAPSDLHVSALVLAELWVGVALARGKRKRERRRAKVEALTELVTVVPFDESIAPAYGRLFADLRKRGKPIPSTDLAIAATAVHHGHDLLVGGSDEAHFQSIRGLRVIVLGGTSRPDRGEGPRTHRS